MLATLQREDPNLKLNKSAYFKNLIAICSIVEGAYEGTREGTHEGPVSLPIATVLCGSAPLCESTPLFNSTDTLETQIHKFTTIVGKPRGKINYDERTFCRGLLASLQQDYTTKQDAELERGIFHILFHKMLKHC
jgi:hypothetical protein